MPAAGIEPLTAGGCIPYGIPQPPLKSMGVSFLRSPNYNKFAYDRGKGGRSGKEIGKAK